MAWPRKVRYVCVCGEIATMTHRPLQAPIAIYTSGKGSSAAGLTATVVRSSSGEFYLEVSATSPSSLLSTPNLQQVVDPPMLQVLHP